MRVLIGTPIHQIKDYCMERWLENVARLMKAYPTADLLMIDNSPNMKYLEKVDSYCSKLEIMNYKIEHFDIKNPEINPDLLRSVNVEVAQEMIRRKILEGGYDAWFSWECDQIIPLDTLEKMVQLMKDGNYMMVVVNSWARGIPGEFNTNMGVTLINKESLERSWFLPDKNGEISLDLADFYNVDETMFKKRILRSGGNYVEIYGVIEPIYHLNN